MPAITRSTAKKRSADDAIGAAAANNDQSHSEKAAKKSKSAKICMKAAKKSKSAKICMIDKLSDEILHLVIRFAGEKVQTLARLCQVDKRFRGAMKDALSREPVQRIDDSSTMEASWRTRPDGIITDILRRNGHDTMEVWEDHSDPNFVNLNLQSLAFYQAVVSAALFEKTTVPSHDARIPKPVSRILSLQELIERYPLVEGNTRSVNVLCSILKHMVQNQILSQIEWVDGNVHDGIFQTLEWFTGHPIYDEYRGTVPENLFNRDENDDGTFRALFLDLPIHLQFLITAYCFAWPW